MTFCINEASTNLRIECRIEYWIPYTSQNLNVPSLTLYEGLINLKNRTIVGQSGYGLQIHILEVHTILKPLSTDYLRSTHWLRTENRLKIYAIFTLKAIFGEKSCSLKTKNPCN
jgi:hypothetical protein